MGFTKTKQDKDDVSLRKRRRDGQQMLKLINKMNHVQGKSGLVFYNIHRCFFILPWEVLCQNVSVSIFNMIFQNVLLVYAGRIVIPWLIQRKKHCIWLCFSPECLCHFPECFHVLVQQTSSNQ